MEHQTLRELLAHSEWADARLWKSLLSSPATAEDPRALTWMHHIHSVQRGFDALWRGEEVDFSKAEDFADAVAVRSWGQEGHARLRETVDAMSREALSEVLPIPWAKYFQSQSDRPAGPVLVRESIQQVAMHSVHHRAQVSSRLRQLGGTPPLIDFIGWLWFERPTANWSDEPIDSTS